MSEKVSEYLEIIKRNGNSPADVARAMGHAEYYGISADQHKKLIEFIKADHLKNEFVISKYYQMRSKLSLDDLLGVNVVISVKVGFKTIRINSFEANNYGFTDLKSDFQMNSFVETWLSHNNYNVVGFQIVSYD